MRSSIFAIFLITAIFIFAGAAKSHADDTFFFNFGHNPYYFALDGDVEDMHSNILEFGVFLDENTRVGIYNEEVRGDITDHSIRGLSTEYDVLEDPFATAIGMMLGNEDAQNNVVGDVYGRFIFQTTANTNINARLAYRTYPDDPDGVQDDAHGVSLSVGFGLNF